MTRSTLRELALGRRLPDHQMMDRETLGWIEVNRRSPPSLPVTPPCRAAMLLPDTGWFAVASLADSLHGVRHSARVSLPASLLAAEFRLGGEAFTAAQGRAYRKAQCLVDLLKTAGCRRGQSFCPATLQTKTPT